MLRMREAVIDRFCQFLLAFDQGDAAERAYVRQMVPCEESARGIPKIIFLSAVKRDADEWFITRSAFNEKCGVHRDNDIRVPQRIGEKTDCAFVKFPAVLACARVRHGGLGQKSVLLFYTLQNARRQVESRIRAHEHFRTGRDTCSRPRVAK